MSETQERASTGRTFEVVTARIVGNPEAGYSTAYYPNGQRFRSKAKAIKHGFAICDSDDFNVAELEGDVLVRFWWMDEHEQFADDLAEIAEACCWEVREKEKADVR